MHVVFGGSPDRTHYRKAPQIKQKKNDKTWGGRFLSRMNGSGVSVKTAHTMARHPLKMRTSSSSSFSAGPWTTSLDPVQGVSGAPPALSSSGSAGAKQTRPPSRRWQGDGRRCRGEEEEESDNRKERSTGREKLGRRTAQRKQQASASSNTSPGFISLSAPSTCHRPRG